MADVFAEDLDDRIADAGNSTPTAADRDWAVEAIFQLSQDMCRERYGPAIGIEPPDVLVEVKYRDTPVDLGAVGFITIPLVPSGDVRQAWWDARNEYMIIDLNGTLYHYCAFSEADVEALALAADSHAHYQSVIRETSDCRFEGVVPSYGHTGVGYDGWNEWTRTAYQELSLDFDLPEASQSAQMDFIGETLVTYCAVLDGAEVDLEALETALQEEVGSGDLDPELAWFQFRLAEIYNQSTVHRSECST